MEPNTSSAPSAPARDLLLQIARCPQIPHALVETDHPCAEVVGAQWQQSVPAEERLARYPREQESPEPWSGNLEKALILFVSSNPSASKPAGAEQRGGEHIFPRDSWEPGDVIDYFHERFERDIIDGRFHRENGKRGAYVAFWGGTLGIAQQLLAGAVPGDDYALTELVRCKSRKELGVEPALEKCTGLYLEETLRRAVNAEVIVALGHKARGWFCKHMTPSFESHLDLGCIEDARIDVWPDRTFTYLSVGHPSGGEARLPENVLRDNPEQLARMRTRLTEAKVRSDR
jgi:uracil-DNA glycosylase